MKNRAGIAASLLLSLAGVAQAAPAELKIATWNLEWFMTAGNPAGVDAGLHASGCAT